MARTIQEIYDSIIAEKQSMAQLNALAPNIDDAQTLLEDVQSTSKVSEWRLWCWVMAFVAWVLEMLLDRHKAEVEAIAAAAVSGTLAWYAAKVLEWQYGDPLVFDPVRNIYTYDPIDATHRIAVRASARDGAGGVVLIKAAKQGSGQELAALSTAELSNLIAYLQEIRFAGTILNTTSLNPDAIVAEIEVYHDPLLDPLVLEPLLQAAAKAYLPKVPFDGLFVKDTLVDAIQAVTGVKWTKVNVLNGVAGAIVTPIITTYPAASGYFTTESSQGTEFTFTLIPAN